MPIAHWGLLIVAGQSSTMSQMFYDINGANNPLYFRVLHNGNWDNWKLNYDSSILTNSDILGPLASALGALKFYTTCIHTTGPGYGKAKWTKIATADWGATEGVSQHMTLLVVGGGAYSNYSFISLLSIARHNADILAKYKVLIGSDIQCGYTLTGNHIDIYLHPTVDWNDYVHVCLLARNSGNNCDVVKELNALSAQPSGWVSISAD